MQSRGRTLKQIGLFLGTAAFAAGCSGATPPALVLKVAGAGAVASQPNPCEINVTFADIAAGQKALATLQITNPSKAVVSLSAPSTPLDPAFTGDDRALKAPLAAGATAKVPLTFAPTSVKASTTSFAIGLSPAAGGCPSITVDLTGNCVAFKLTVNPTSLDLGSVILDTTVAQTVSLMNQSVDPVDELTATLSGGGAEDFTVTGLPDWLDAGASADVGISFRPLTGGFASATVTFAGSQGTSVKLNLNGEPVAEPLMLDPNPLDLGYVLPDYPATLCTTAQNVAAVPVTITGMRNFINPSGAFTLASTDDSTPPQPAPIPVTIAPGASSKVCFTLTAVDLPPTQYTGQATLLTDQPSVTYQVLQLTGWSGGPVLTCNVPSVSFGPCVDGTTTTLSILCSNTGTGGVLPNLGLNPNATPSMFTAAFDTATHPYPPAGLGPGQTTQIDVSYTPTASGTDQGTLTIASNGGQGAGLQIPLSGQALNLAPCQFAITPSSLDFGNVLPDGGRVDGGLRGSFAVENLGSDACLVKDLALASDPKKNFQILSTSLQPDPQTGWITIPPDSGLDGGLQVDLAFTPRDAGAATASAAFWISVPADVNQAVPLRGTSGFPCLAFAPPTLDFGQIGVSSSGTPCQPATQSLSVTNQCSGSTTLQSVSVQTRNGDSRSQFYEQSGPTLPQPVNTPQSFTFSFGPTSLGSHSAVLVFSEGGVDSFVPITGTAVAQSCE